MWVGANWGLSVWLARANVNSLLWGMGGETLLSAGESGDESGPAVLCWTLSVRDIDVSGAYVEAPRVKGMNEPSPVDSLFHISNIRGGPLTESLRIHEAGLPSIKVTAGVVGQPALIIAGI